MTEPAAHEALGDMCTALDALVHALAQHPDRAGMARDLSRVLVGLAGLAMSLDAPECADMLLDLSPRVLNETACVHVECPLCRGTCRHVDTHVFQCKYCHATFTSTST